ncbi:LINE-1 retrotransposable element ORF2 protein [Holothuria leucospilota]|uniref:LINE-1 retrotransposable element ORF2 protein n=1 Tax=Holothuria leucospilota TaxID=206669 RepID=A0A9Q1BCV1_HOLLE|nr:LINE-1 retrotransposable element ORF2 protein [Holothuria leucospilota]
MRNILNEFQYASGLKINLGKSHLFPLGPLILNQPEYLCDFGITPSFGPIKFLGISFNHNGDKLFRLNYLQKLSRLKSILHVWSMRDLTPIGKNIIVKSFALSQFVFLFQVLPDPPDYFIKDVQGCIFDFIWSCNPDKVRRNTMYNSIENGGLKITHVRSFISALKIIWVKRYRDEDDRIWKLFFDYYLRRYRGQFLFDCNFSSQDVIGIKNVFIRNVCCAWGTMNFHHPHDNFDSQILWNNSYININKTIVFL